MIQKLQGVKITPRGSTNRFASQNWPNSYAFGGWIYDVSTTIGYNNSPTEIKMSIVLETSTFDQSAARFDINKDDLKCDAGAGGLNNETWFDIELEGINFKNFLLYEYNFSIEVNQKVLSVTFKDYSIILDKIYVGLFKKQSYIQLFERNVLCKVQFPVQCQDCRYDGFSSIEGLGETDRGISFASYVGSNEKILDNFGATYFSIGKNVYDYWNDFINEAVNPGENNNNGKFDLNGGYLIIGTESVSEQRCNSAPNITYSFIELLASLRKAGLNFLGDFPISIQNSDYLYRNNYIGPLREVLQNWCSDLGYTFYCEGRNFVGIDLKDPIDISEITKVADPTTSLGQNFSLKNGESAILSFNSSASLGNTFKQSVIVENSHPATEVNNQKNIKRYIGITPLHPISLNSYDADSIKDTNINGRGFSRPRFETKWFDDAYVGQNKNVIFNILDGRSYSDLDTSIALVNYNETLRDLFVAQKALQNIGSTDPLSNPYCMANFSALGMNPILEITGVENKEDILSEFFSNGEKNDTTNLSLNPTYYKIYLGYYNQDLKNEVIEWEKKAANSMYKYGVVTNGNLINFPYVSPNLFEDASPEEGFLGKRGLWLYNITNNFTPETDRYATLEKTPFIDLLLYSGLVKNANSNFSISSERIPTGLWIAELDNQWGTSVEDFNKQLSDNFQDVCASKYSFSDSVSEVFNISDKEIQDWKLEYFAPIASPSLEKVADIVEQISGQNPSKIQQSLDFVVNTYIDTHLKEKKECKKLHVIIIPDTKKHPNLNISFTQNPRNRINQKVLKAYQQKVFEAEEKKRNTKTPSICSLSIAQEMCENALQGNIRSLNGGPLRLSDDQLGCQTIENKNDYFIDGFSEDTLFNINSRSLTINIAKNPPGPPNPTYDVNGDFYLSDLADGFLEVSTKNVTLEIVYPVQCESNGYGNYLGILSTDISSDVRLPSLTQIYGSPSNSKNNNTTSLKVINNTTDSSLNPQLNKVDNQVISYMTVIKEGGQGNIVATPEQYYNLISNLNNYNLDEPAKNIQITLAGTPNQFGSFKDYIKPSYGLSQFTISVGDNGVKTTLSFSDRPKTLPKQETILNSIGPRIKGIYN